MSFLSFLKTSDKALDTAANVVNGAVSGIDALFFTEEEKSKASLEVVELWLKMQDVTANENSARSITRRYLAFGFLSLFILLILFGTGIWKWYPEWAAFVFSVVKSISNIILAIVIFYFGYFGIKEVLKK